MIGLMFEVAILKLTAASKFAVGNHDVHFHSLWSVLPLEGCLAHLGGSAVGTRAMMALCSVCRKVLS